MPIYNFKCTKCNHKFEVLKKEWTDKTICPRCGEEAKKQVSAHANTPNKWKP